MVEDVVCQAVSWRAGSSSDVDDGGADGSQLRDSGYVGRGSEGRLRFTASH